VLLLTSKMHYTLCQPNMTLMKEMTLIHIPVHGIRYIPYMYVRYVYSFYSSACQSVSPLIVYVYCWLPMHFARHQTFAFWIRCHQDRVTATMPYDQVQCKCWHVLWSLCCLIAVAITEHLTETETTLAQHNQWTSTGVHLQPFLGPFQLFYTWLPFWVLS
jgi:hypothetical protein